VRIVDALTARNQLTAVHVPASEEQRRARRERQAAEHARAITSSKEEIPRKQLEFSRYWIEDTETGNLYIEFGGHPSYAPTVHHYYVRSDSRLVMLEPAEPPSRAELERRQARKEERRAERQAAAKERYRQLRKAAK
jgi:hypothetical protein